MAIMLDGREVMPGARMWSMVQGWVEVSHVDESAKDYEINCNDGNGLYTKDGQYFPDGPRCLFWDEVRIDPPPPPKPKVKKWRWVFEEAGCVCMTAECYENEDAVLAAFGSRVRRMQKIEFTEIEVEE